MDIKATNTTNTLTKQEKNIFAAIIIAVLCFSSMALIKTPTTSLDYQRSSTAQNVPLFGGKSGGGKSGQMQDCLSRVSNVRGVALYAQNDEDGALLQILRCMGGHGKKEYFEFGSQDGSEVNTRVLRDLYGWKGHLLDGGNENPAIPLHQEFITPSNIASLLLKYQVSKDLDVLSVDVDYDDFWVIREILLAGYKPRVLISEYNVNFASSWSVSVPAKPIGKESEIMFQGNCYFGVSATALMSLVQAFGYTPVFTNMVNIMFVRLDQAQELNMIIPSIENFPDPNPIPLHRDCDGRTWKLIDPDTIEHTATNPKISHTAFANSFSDVTLKTSLFHKPGREKWRIFTEL